MKIFYETDLEVCNACSFQPDPTDSEVCKLGSVLDCFGDGRESYKIISPEDLTDAEIKEIRATLNIIEAGRAKNG